MDRYLIPSPPLTSYLTEKINKSPPPHFLPCCCCFCLLCCILGSSSFRWFDASCGRSLGRNPSSGRRSLCQTRGGEGALSLSLTWLANREEATEAAQFAVACYLSGGRGRERKKGEKPLRRSCRRRSRRHDFRAPRKGRYIPRRRRRLIHLFPSFPAS